MTKVTSMDLGTKKIVKAYFYTIGYRRDRGSKVTTLVWANVAIPMCVN